MRAYNRQPSIPVAVGASLVGLAFFAAAWFLGLGLYELLHWFGLPGWLILTLTAVTIITLEVRKLRRTS